MSFTLEGQRALVIGAAGGIGQATARVMAKLGAELVPVDRVASEELLDQICMAGGSSAALGGRMGGLIAGPHYVASKGGLHALVKWLAQRGGPQNVLVNGVAPASTETAMIAGQRVDLTRIPLRRKSEPHEIAWPIAFLCSPAASYVCGTVLDVNGGVVMV